MLVRHPSLHGTTAAGYQLPVPVQLERHSTGSLRGCAESKIDRLQNLIEVAPQVCFFKPVNYPI